jgi:AraC family transcriptional regulator
MQRVVAYVYAHLDEPLDLMKLSEVAGMSAFHWHRVFQSMYGESMVSTVKRLRLHRAAGELANSNRPIGRVAQAAGYPNVQSFTRVFKGAYGLPPAQYRERGAHADFKVQTHAEDLTDRPVEIRELDAMQLVSVPHRGSYMHIGAAFDQLFGRLAARGLARPGMRLIALFYDDPSVIPEGDPGLFNAKSCQAVPTRLALTSRAFDERP